jgi:transcriptional regulator with XRE-family HTH domain
MTTTTANVAINGDELRRRRQLLGETQRSFAAKAQVSDGYVSHIEAGRRLTVSPPTFVQICDALGLAAIDRELMIRKPDAA